MKKTPNYQKELYRGTIKQIMKVRGLRTISLANYNSWLKETGVSQISPNVAQVHSLKLDVQDGYVNIFGYNKNKCGEKIENASAELYEGVYNQVMDIINKEHVIPSKIKRNILVKVFR